VTDEFGGARPFATGAMVLTIEGPGEIIGDNPFSLVGGVGAVWIKTKEAEGTIRLSARHPQLGTKAVGIRVKRFATDGLSRICNQSAFDMLDCIAPADNALGSASRAVDCETIR